MATHCATAIERYKPDHVFIEGDGIGGPVIELLKKAGYNITEVLVSKTAQDPTTYYLHRTELWGRMRDWLNTGVLPKEDGLISDLCVMRYSINLKGQVALWPKEKMRKEGFASPDYADALAMTFSRNVSRLDGRTARRGRRKRVARDVDYELFG